MRDRSRQVLAGLMAGAGVTHFVAPGFFDALMPDWVPGPARAWTYGSGVVELACGALLARRDTARLGAGLTFATLAVVWSANWNDALTHPPTDVRGAVSWVRLPLQLPLLAWAWGHVRPPAVEQPSPGVEVAP